MAIPDLDQKMEITLSHLGIGNHLSTLEEERRNAVRIKELLQEYYNQESSNPFADLASIRARLDSAQRLADSISRRILFLRELSEDFRLLSEKAEEVAEERKGALR